MSLRTLYDEASLWMTPGGYEDGKLFSELPTDGSGDFTFTRGSNLAATRVGADGLIEKGRENLLIYSNTFNNSTWSKTNGSSVASGYLGYDGTNNAFLFTDSGANSSYGFYQQFSLSGVLTFSIYLKAGSDDTIGIDIFSSVKVARANINLTSGTITGSNDIDVAISDVSNGWYRCSVTGDLTNAIYVRMGTGSDGGTFYGMNAQLEAGLVATDYIETGASTAQAGILEDMPRLDYSGGASCPALLLEPQRSNLLTQSEYFGDSQWLVDGVSLDANNITSPEGLQNAYKITDDTTTGYHLITDSDVFLADGVMRTWSVFVKKGTARYCVIGAGNQFVVQDNALIFDMEEGTYTSTGTSSFFDTIHDPINMGNGWYRIGFSSDLNSSSYNKFSIGVSQGATWSGNVSYTGDGSLNYYIFGAQVESGSYPTSYIPTYGSSVTRSVDNSSITGLNFLPNGEGTVFIEFEIDEVSMSGYPELFRIYNPSDATDFVLCYLFEPLAGDIRIGYRLDVDNDRKFEASSSVALGTNKMTVRLQRGAYTAYLNGVEIPPSSPYNDVADANMTTLRIKAQPFIANERIKQFATFSATLTDSECIAMTTL